MWSIRRHDGFSCSEYIALSLLNFGSSVNRLIMLSYILIGLSEVSNLRLLVSGQGLSHTDQSVNILEGMYLQMFSNNWLGVWCYWPASCVLKAHFMSYWNSFSYFRMYRMCLSWKECMIVIHAHMILLEICKFPCFLSVWLRVGMAFVCLQTISVY